MFLLNMFCLAAVNLVGNADLKDLSPEGLPMKFTVSGKVSVIDDNCVQALQFDPVSEKGCMVVQNSLPLQEKTAYRLTWWARGEKAKYRIYIENSSDWHNYGGSTWRQATAEWQQFQMDFVYSNKNKKLPYLVIHDAGPGRLSVKNLQLFEAGSEVKRNPIMQVDLQKVNNKSDGSVRVSYDTAANCIKINENPFFPLVLWSIPGGDQLESGMATAANNGINCLHSHLGNDSKATLDLAEKYHLKVILRIDSIVKDNPNAFHNFYENLSSEVVNHPALLGYFLADEPLWTGKPLEPLLHAYRIVKKIDPNHPVWINEAPRNTVDKLAEYTNACDIFGADIYPVGSSSHSDLPEKGLPAVGQYTVQMRQAVKNQKPILMALQAFAWAEAMPNGNAAVYPDRIQSRFMAYDSLINGACGVSWWGREFIKDQKFYDVLFAATREMAQMSDILAAPQAKAKPVCSAKGIEFMVKQTPQGQVLIAANLTDKPISANFKTSLSGLSTVLFENRQIGGGSFSDTFKPYEVHVYAESGVVLRPLPEQIIVPFCPFRKVAVQVKKEPYTGHANWIWYPGKSESSGFKCEFSREIKLSAVPTEAILTVFADDYGKVKINGRVVGADNFSGDVTAFFHAGVNRLDVAAADGGQPPGALLFDLQIKMADGSLQNIISDKSWECKDVRTGTVASAEILFPYGSGPWGNKLMVNVN